MGWRVEGRGSRVVVRRSSLEGRGLKVGGRVQRSRVEGQSGLLSERHGGSLLLHDQQALFSMRCFHLRGVNSEE
eukprot:1080976-Rhodomonas_salina.1